VIIRPHPSRPLHLLQTVRALRWRWALASLPFLAHAAWAAATHRFQLEHGVELVLVLVSAVAGPRLKKLFAGIYPLALVGLPYDAMKAIENLGVSAQSVHLCDLRAHEVALFGVNVNGVRGSLHDWFQLHSSPVLDRICAVPYATFILVCVSFAVWLYGRAYPRMVRFGWCFFALNVAAFVTYHLYPSAPPWYYHAHGCTIDVNAAASEGPNLARVDAWLGVHYFAGMYGRASDVFGAMPSMHCAYACLVALEGWAVFSRPWRVASVGFFALMCFSAVYLDHHWVLDAIGGITYCVTVVAIARVLMPARAACESVSNPSEATEWTADSRESSPS
jgi:inositol phosphorylceramide synthase catalytic subunit